MEDGADDEEGESEDQSPDRPTESQQIQNTDKNFGTKKASQDQGQKMTDNHELMEKMAN